MRVTAIADGRLAFGERRFALLLADQVDEALEEVVRSCGPGEASGWCCTEKTGLPVTREAAIGAVEQRNVSFFNAFRQRLRVDREAVVHRDDLDLAGGVVLDRMVGAVMALMHLLGLGAERQRQHLVAEADAEDRDVGVEQVLITGTAYSPVAAGSPGPLERKMPSGCMARMSSARGLGRHDGDLGAEAGKQAQDVALDAVVEATTCMDGLVLFAIAFVPDPGRFAPDARTGRR